MFVVMQLEEASAVLDLLANKDSLLNLTYLQEAKAQVSAVQLVLLAAGGMPCLGVPRPVDDSNQAGQQLGWPTTAPYPAQEAQRLTIQWLASCQRISIQCSQPAGLLAAEKHTVAIIVAIIQ